METKDKKIWFPAKKYGWGWGPPCVWQGWAVMAGFIVVLSGTALFLMPKHPLAWGGCVVIASAINLAIVYAKGEKPHWRWGNGDR